MGFFSWDCKECGHPMLCAQAIEDKNKWMTDVVVLLRDGTVFKGEYDGYGRVSGREIDDLECGAYHEHCWEKAGGTHEFTKGSVMSQDQGWFFDDNVHNIDPPK